MALISLCEGRILSGGFPGALRSGQNAQGLMRRLKWLRG